MEGTYPLPEAQLDRFLLKVIVPSPTEDEMTEILNRTTGRERGDPSRVLSREEVQQLRALCRDVAVAEPILRYASRLVRASDPALQGAPDLVRRGLRFGAGVRGAQSLVLAAKAVAMLDGRAHAAFSDVQRVARPVLRHRLIRSFEGEADGITTDQVVSALVEAVPTRPEAVEKAMGK
jgi:MoxR-like ATPase